MRKCTQDFLLHLHLDLHAYSITIKTNFSMKNVILTGVTLDDFLMHIEKVIDNRLGAQAAAKVPDQSEYITHKEVAALLKVCLPTLHDWTKLGWLKSYKLGNRVL